TGGMRRPRMQIDGEASVDDALFMDGTEVFNFTLQRVPRLVVELMKKAGVTDDEIDLYIFHQANAWMLEALRRKLKLPAAKFFVSMATCANTVSATIPIALHEAIEKERIRPGSRVLLAGFGVGYSWAGCIARF